MITVTIHNNGFTAEGHADFASEGQDIVCSAVSVLTQTTLLGLAKHIPRLNYIVDATGYLNCVLPELKDATQRIKAKTLLSTMVLGLKDIEKNYPGYVKVIEPA